MLEESTLLLNPWESTSCDPSAARALILGPGSPRPLGFVRRQLSSGFLAWLWRRAPDLTVHESEDEPLLLTIHQGFGPWPSWYVRDADGHLVGRVYGELLYDGGDRLLAQLQPEPGTDAAVYRNDKEELARTTAEEEGVYLTFLPGAGDNPFVKMVLLASALLHNRLLK